MAELSPRSSAERHKIERTAAQECAATLRDMAGRIDSPSALGGYLSEKGTHAINGVLNMLDVVTQFDDPEPDREWRERLRGYLHEIVDRHLGELDD